MSMTKRHFAFFLSIVTLIISIPHVNLTTVSAAETVGNTHSCGCIIDETMWEPPDVIIDTSDETCVVASEMVIKAHKDLARFLLRVIINSQMRLTV